MGDACRLTPDYVVVFERGCQTLLWLRYLLPGQEDILIGLVHRWFWPFSNSERRESHNDNGQKAGRLLGLRLVPLGDEGLGLVKAETAGQPCYSRFSSTVSCQPQVHRDRTIQGSGFCLFVCFFFAVGPGCQEGGLALSERFPRDRQILAGKY